jgi:hypothetical protein
LAQNVPPELRMSFADAASLEQELAHNLRYGRAFLKDIDVKGIDVLSDCVLVLVHPEGFELRVTAQAVMVSDSPAMCGVGLELRPFGPAVLARIEAFARGEREPSAEASASDPPVNDAAPSSAAAVVADAASSDDEEPLHPQPQPEASSEPQDEEELDTEESLDTPDAEPTSELDTEAGDQDAHDDDADEGQVGTSGVQQQEARHERLRKLSQVQQQKIARSGELGDRVMLERLFGKAVWDALLHNPKVTPPEVARIARKGTVPRPLLDFIIDNAAWVQAGAVRRALLGNPRVTGEGVMKLLRLTPKHELKAMTKGTAYASHVRDAARKLLKI